MVLAGLSIPDREVLGLARRLRDEDFVDTAERLEDAYDSEVRVLGLSIDGREEILRSLAECPDPLLELRAVLLQQ
jgi:hypothetical protein